LIWKVSTKQKKERLFLSSALQHWERRKQEEEEEEAEPNEKGRRNLRDERMHKQSGKRLLMRAPPTMISW
jgi:hypothetical protein